MRNLLLTFFLGCLIGGVQAGKLTHISAEIIGYTGKDVVFGFVEEPTLTMQFPYVENQLMEFDVELNDITMMRINGWVYICLQPGDSLHAKIVYEGNVYKTVEYSGSKQVVAAAEFLHQLRQMRKERRYHFSAPGAFVLKIPVDEYYAATLKEWRDETDMLEQQKEDLSDHRYNYLKSEIEGVLLPNLIMYPFAFKGISEQKLPEGYWSVLDDYQLRQDQGSLRNRQYVSFLTPYKAYMKSKRGGDLNPEFIPQKDLEKEYTDLVNFYEGNIRDAALFAFFYNAIVASADLKLVEKLKKEYQKKYNLNKTYKTTLDGLMK